MSNTIQMIVLLLGVLAVVGVVAKRLTIPPSILLVLAGVALAIVPGLPQVTLAPEVVLLLILPPVVYWSAVSMSWREFRFNLRPISLLAVGCVVFTTVAAAAAAHWLLGMSWPVGFILGAIVSPPDEVAPLSVARRLLIPKRILVILEGEGLANDATALILYRFAVVALSVGAFSLGKAAGLFAVIVGSEVLWGIAVGWMMLRIRRWVRDPQIEILLSILTPFVAYWLPVHLGGSGVLATVTTGLYVSWNGSRIISSATRLQGIFFWEVLTYLVEGFLFLLTGLQARAMTTGIGHYSVRELVVAAVVLNVVVIATRFVWVYPATYLPRWLFPALARRDPSPPWQWPFALAFTGVRGVVSLAAALALPLVTVSGDAFPDRDLVLFLTFAVVLVTLVGQGLLLPVVMRGLGLANAGAHERDRDATEELGARRAASEAALERLDYLSVERHLPEAVSHPLRLQYQQSVRHFAHRRDRSDSNLAVTVLHDEIELLLVGAQRDRVNELYRRGALSDDGRRRIEREFDLREASISSHNHDE